jgi:hypothetical protein
VKVAGLFLCDHPLLQVTLAAARAVFIEKPEINNYCSTAGTCQARNSEELKSCTYFKEPFFWIGCRMLSKSGGCLNDKANITAKKRRGTKS